jgi:plasmid stabilization system protein ParE
MDKPSAAGRMVGLIETSADRLRLFPQMGRSSRRAKTREFAVPSTPFVIIYRATGAEMEILALYHGAQDWKKLL